MSDTLKRRDKDAYPFLYKVNTRFTDTDQAGHLNNVSIFVYYQDGQARFLLDCFPELAAAARWSLRFVSGEASYDGQTYYPDPIEIATGVEQLGDNWVLLAQALFQRGQCVGLCEAVLVKEDEQRQALAFTAAERVLLESRRLRG